MPRGNAILFRFDGHIGVNAGDVVVGVLVNAFVKKLSILSLMVFVAVTV